MNAKTDDLITRFLLGELSDEERAQVEQRFLADNEFFEEMLSAEDALMDQYLLGQLSDRQRERAEALFHSSRRQKRDVSFTEELITSLRKAEPSGTQTAQTGPSVSGHLLGRDAARRGDANAPRFGVLGRAFSASSAALKSLASRLDWAGGLAFALLLLCLVLVSLIVYRYSRTESREAERAESERSGQKTPEKAPGDANSTAELKEQSETSNGKGETAEELVAQTHPRKPEAGEVVILTPTALERGGGSKTVKLKTGAGRVKLQLELDEGKRYGRYSVSISSFDGRKVWSDDSLDAGQIRKGRITLTLPSSLFRYDDYRIELKGLPDGGEPVRVADYVFKVRD
ncbi:MAG: hypothetical protein ACJ74T_08340 [Pyrinomonadaceae bacterium]